MKNIQNPLFIPDAATFKIELEKRIHNPKEVSELLEATPKNVFEKIAYTILFDDKVLISPEITHLFIQKGALIDQVEEGHTPWSLAIHKGYFGTAALLCKKNASITLQNQTDLNALKLTASLAPQYPPSFLDKAQFSAQQNLTSETKEIITNLLQIFPTNALQNTPAASHLANDEFSKKFAPALLVTFLGLGTMFAGALFPPLVVVGAAIGIGSIFTACALGAKNALQKLSNRNQAIESILNSLPEPLLHDCFKDPMLKKAVTLHIRQNISKDLAEEIRDETLGNKEVVIPMEHINADNPLLPKAEQNHANIVPFVHNNLPNFSIKHQHSSLKRLTREAWTYMYPILQEANIRYPGYRLSTSYKEAILEMVIDIASFVQKPCHELVADPIFKVALLDALAPYSYQRLPEPASVAEKILCDWPIRQVTNLQQPEHEIVTEFQKLFPPMELNRAL